MSEIYKSKIIHGPDCAHDNILCYGKEEAVLLSIACYTSPLECTKFKKNNPLFQEGTNGDKTTPEEEGKHFRHVQLT